MNKRQKIDTLFSIACRSALILSCLILFFFLSCIVWRGAPSISIDFISQASRKFGSEGGILYQILGSLLLVTVAALLCFPVALGLAIFKSEYLKSPSWQKFSNILIYTLNAVPSIIFGLFGLIFFINFLETGISWFVGSIILATMILPTVTLSIYHALDKIPSLYRESALALGLNKWQVIYKVLIPQSLSGAISGLLIGIARAIGETAPIMFIATAFSGVDTPRSLFEPVASLPTHILALAQEANTPQALQNAWGSSLVLLLLVMLFSGIALSIRLKGTHL